MNDPYVIAIELAHAHATQNIPPMTRSEWECNRIYSQCNYDVYLDEYNQRQPALCPYPPIPIRADAYDIPGHILIADGPYEVMCKRSNFFDFLVSSVRSANALEIPVQTFWKLQQKHAIPSSNPEFTAIALQIFRNNG